MNSLKKAGKRTMLEHQVKIKFNMNRAKLARKWFACHEDALARISQIRISEKSNARRVKIAILDSGIDLSQHQMEMYNDAQPQMVYRSWIDGDPIWKDEVGHGTHLAVLLRKMAPEAIIHVGRVYIKKPTWDSASTVAQVPTRANPTAS